MTAPKHKFQFRVEMAAGQDQRIVDADSWTLADDWIVFMHYAPEGGQREHWRVQKSLVISMETKQP